MRVQRSRLGVDDLYCRGVDTLIASWGAYASGVRGARTLQAPGVAAAIFPTEPERGVYNNAVVDRGLAARERAAALDVLEASYADAGVDRFAVWVHESDAAMLADVQRRRYEVDTWTRAMAMELADLALPRPQLSLAAPGWTDYLRTFDMPPGLLADADMRPFRVRVAQVDGELATTAMAFDHETDCGIYNVGTVEHARRRGLGSAVTLLQLHDARARGCETASLQATPIAERMYGAVGFRDLGRFVEYVPPTL